MFLIFTAKKKRVYLISLIHQFTIHNQSIHAEPPGSDNKTAQASTTQVEERIALIQLTTQFHPPNPLPAALKNKSEYTREVI